MLEAREICKSYYDRAVRRQRVVLDNCSLSIGEGEAVALMGESGCGKSTLARIMLRLLPADSGRVLFRGQDITGAGGRSLLPFRRQVQLLSQRPESFFDPLLTLGQSLREPRAIFGLACGEEEISSLLELVKLNKALLERYPHQVSGGEIQRAALARALLLQPRLLVLDEPTSMLDISVQAQILQLLRQIRREKQLAYLLITHDGAVARFMCDRTVRMEKGRITKT